MNTDEALDDLLDKIRADAATRVPILRNQMLTFSPVGVSVWEHFEGMVHAVEAAERQASRGLTDAETWAVMRRHNHKEAA